MQTKDLTIAWNNLLTGVKAACILSSRLGMVLNRNHAISRKDFMTHFNTISEIQVELENNVGETGNAKIQNDGLYIQREENADWMFHGTVSDTDAAMAVVAEYFTN